MKKQVLILAAYYIPSIKGGGPIQSIKNIVDNLSDKVDFHIITSDRDLGDNHSFSGIVTNKWLKVGKAQVYYTNPLDLTWRKTANIINSIDYDVLYLNSFFSYKFSIVPILLRKFNKISKKPIALAPRGEFSPGALQLKGFKKKLYIKTSKLFNIYKNIIWHATSETEKNYIETIFENRYRIVVANNLTPNYKDLKFDKTLEKKKGEIKIVFISRIHPKKNLKMAIELLPYVDGNIEFNIFGPIEDSQYWITCKKMIKNMPKNISVSYKGIVNNDKVIDIFKEHHVFLFPTLGENFGHVILEALMGGCPVIISDQTPWTKLEEKKIGWNINLSKRDSFINALNICVKLKQEDYNKMSKRAFKYAKEVSNNQLDIEKTKNLFLF